MPNLDPKDVAAWFREQAKRCMTQAKEFEEMARGAEKVNMVMHWGTTPSPVQPLPANGTLTSEQLEQRIRRKSARVYNIANEFNVPSKHVEALLSEPKSKVYMAGRGWLKIKP